MQDHAASHHHVIDDVRVSTDDQSLSVEAPHQTLERWCSALYISLYRIDGLIELYGIDTVVQPLVALPDGVHARRAVPRPREESAALCEAPPHRAEGGRRRRRRAVVRHRLPRVPLPGCKDDRTGPLGIGSAHPGDGVETPGDAHVNRQGVHESLRRLHAHPFKLTPVLQPPDKPRYCPPPARPGPHRARPGTSPPRPTGQESPRHRFFRLGWAALRGLDRADLDRRQLASRPTRPLEGPLGGRHREGHRSGRPRRWAGAFAGACPQGGRRRPLGPSRPLGGTWREAPSTCGPDDPRGPWVGLPAPRGHPPLLELTVAIGPVHHQRGGTGLVDRAGVLIACQPTGALLLFHGVALALLGSRRRGPRPTLPPHHASMDALGRKTHRGMEPRRCTRVALHGAHPGLRLGRAVMQQRRVVDQPHARLRAAALHGGLERARQHLLDTTVRVIQNTLGGDGLCPAVTRGRHPADRSRAQPAS
jgi:hypothetical protein